VQYMGMVLVSQQICLCVLSEVESVLLYKNEKGSASIILTVSITVLLAFAVVGVDVGLITFERARLSNALDAAALAGAQELPGSTSEAIHVARSYLTANSITLSDATVIVDSDGKGLQIASTKTFNTIFGPLINRNSVSVSVESKVRVGSVSKVRSGIRPLVIESQVLGYGQLVDLKLNAADNYHGNFGAVGLGGTGALNYRNNLIYGYTGEIEIGDVIYTEPGNMASVINPLNNYLSSDASTFDNFERDSKRLWVVPIVNTLQVSGSSPVTVVGFAEFFIEEIGSQSGQTSIQGRFIKYSGGGIVDESAPDYGLYGMKLVP